MRSRTCSDKFSSVRNFFYTAPSFFHGVIFIGFPADWNQLKIGEIEKVAHEAIFDMTGNLSR